MQPNMNMLQEVQNRMRKLQEDLADLTVVGSAGGGAVTCEMTGLQVVKAIHIAPEAVDLTDLSLLEDAVTAAVNDAQTKAKAMASQQLGGLGLPGIG